MVPSFLTSSLLVVFLAACESRGFEFRLPQRVLFTVEADELRHLVSPGPQWLRARRQSDSTNLVEFGSRVVVQLRAGAILKSVVADRPLKLVRIVSTNAFILQAPDAATAVREAAGLAALREVSVSYPVIRNKAQLDSLYAAAPNDPHFPPQLGNTIGQWYLENRDTTNGASLGVDVNVRGAWPHTRGEGVTIAVADVGVEITHREFTNRAPDAPHRNFNDGSTNVVPMGASGAWAHGTACAGLAAASGDNGFGMTGVASEAKVAAWVVFRDPGTLVSDEQLMEMYQFASNAVHVQNHSWGRGGPRQIGPTLLEQIGLANAIEQGREGKGAVIVRSAGNDRARGANANDDYPADPRIISVGSVARSGLVTSASEPGACLLLAAPSAEAGTSGLFTTDLSGANGVNFVNFFPPFEYLSDFAFNALGFSGTSASAPLVAGLAALVLSANSQLTYRDVQQILLLSARQFDFGDPDLRANGAGFWVSHNVGFGVPDAGQAVRLARSWPNRPPLTVVTVGATNTVTIPDDGLRLLIFASPDEIEALASFGAAPGTGLFPDTSTLRAPLVDVGEASDVPAIDLTGKGALIERSADTTFAEKIFNVAAAGAEFAVIYNFATNTNPDACPGGDQLCPMGATDFVPIPAVFVGHNDGIVLRELFATDPNAQAQIHLEATNYVFTVTNTLLLEHVGVRLQTDHSCRGDLRITLVSPSGVRSVLQRLNGDTDAGPVDWTYWSTHHFYESCVGAWRLEVSDQLSGSLGSVLSASLVLRGTEITDGDADGLDDGWEQTHFSSLARGPREDPDEDGFSNAREQVMGTNPNAADEVFRIDLARWNAQLLRLNWPGVANRTYQIWGGPEPSSLSLITNLPGRFPETEWFANTTNEAARFFQVRTAEP